jgi:hypothetical protein
MGSNAMACCSLVLLFQGRAGEWNSPPSCPEYREFMFRLDFAGWIELCDKGRYAF